MLSIYIVKVFELLRLRLFEIEVPTLGTSVMIAVCGGGYPEQLSITKTLKIFVRDHQTRVHFTKVFICIYPSESSAS